MSCTCEGYKVALVVVYQINFAFDLETTRVDAVNFLEGPFYLHMFESSSLPLTRLEV